MEAVYHVTSIVTESHLGRLIGSASIKLRGAIY